MRRGPSVALLATLALALAGPDGAAAQPAATPAVDTVRPAPATGTLDVAAFGAEDRAPIAFALVRLLPAGATGARAQDALRQGVTTAGGRFRFADVPAGEYRLQLARIGYQPVLSPPLRVTAGATLRHEFSGAAQPIQLAAVTVQAGERCIGVDRLAEEPRLAAIWTEARKGVEVRRAFERQYRFTDIWRQDGTIKYRLRGTRPLHRVDTTVYEPDSADVRERRRYARLRQDGHVQGGNFALPNEKDLVHEEFLRDFCLEPATADSGDLVGLAFRPRDPGRDVGTVRGTLWLDATTYLARRLDIQWIKGDEVLAEGSRHYADVPVTGTALRLPFGGHITVRRVLGPMRMAIRGGAVTITDAYQNFVLVHGR